MIMDKNVEFADAVNCFAAAGTANIGNIINSEVVRDLGQGQPIYLIVTVDTEIITGGSAGTMLLQLVSDSTDTIATNGTASIHVQSEDYITDGADANDPELKEGQVIWQVMLPGEGNVYEQYLALQVVTSTTTTTAGAINAFLTLDPHGWKSYADAAN